VRKDESPVLRLILVAGVLLWLAGGCQQSAAVPVSLGSFAPNYLLLVMAVLAPYMSTFGSATVGLFAGIVQGGLAGANLTAYSVSRIFAGLAVGKLHQAELAQSPFVAALSAAVTVVVAQAVLLFLAPTVNVGAFVLATMGTAIYNGVLAVPLDWAIGKVLRNSAHDR
jgi:rod shape-determining protein MreD